MYGECRGGAALPCFLSAALPHAVSVATSRHAQLELLGQALANQHRLCGNYIILGKVCFAFAPYLQLLGSAVLFPGAGIQRHIIAVFVLFVHVVLDTAEHKLRVAQVLLLPLATFSLQRH